MIEGTFGNGDVNSRNKLKFLYQGKIVRFCN